jgi:hypothetical protein
LYQVSPAGNQTRCTAPPTSVVTGITMIDGPHMYCRSWVYAIGLSWWSITMALAIGTPVACAVCATV